MADDPVSIRTNNPGAMWMGPVAAQFGASGRQSLPGGNNAAIFDDPVNGAAAHFALLGKNYAGMPLSGAIAKWSGGNSSPAYTNFIGKQTGLGPDTVLTPELLAGPQGLALAKAQAHWEAGKAYPLSDEQWQTAQAKAYGNPASGAGAVPMAPAAAAQATSPTGAAGSGGAAPAADAPPAAGMLAGADLSGKGPDIGQLAQRAMGMMAPQEQQVAPLKPLAIAMPKGLSPAVLARLQMAALRG